MPGGVAGAQPIMTAPYADVFSLFWQVDRSVVCSRWCRFVFSQQQASFIQVLRASAALIIVFHHFALYAPLNEWAAPLIGDLLDWLANYARATQVFFVVGGYVAARTLSRREWTFGACLRFGLARYCRLGLPMLAVLLMVIPIYAFARGWVSDEVIGAPVDLAQFLAHLFLLQDILGYEPLSAGLWFVCINFQLSMGFVLGLAAQRRWAPGGEGLFASLSWGGSLCSLFYFNLDPAWDDWAIYFLPYFFLGVLVYRAVHLGRRGELLLFQALLVLALMASWRWRLVIAMLFAMVLFVAERSGLGQRWPRNAWLASLGEISFSLFLVHFPVLVLVGALWARLGWDSPEAALLGLLCAFIGSLVSAAVFHRWVEKPAAEFSRFVRHSPDAEGPGERLAKPRKLVFET